MAWRRLTDVQWARLKEHLPAHPPSPGVGRLCEMAISSVPRSPLPSRSCYLPEGVSRCEILRGLSL